MPASTVAISSDFLTAFAALPKRVQQKTSTFINKFRADPASPGIHYEKIANADGKFYSVRIDNTYRGIVVRQPETDTYLLLWVDHHDEAYEWARRRRCSVNAVTGSIQVYEVTEGRQAAAVGQKPSIDTSLFAAFSDEQLLRVGVPQEQLTLVRTFVSIDDLEGASASIPADAHEGLLWLANGFEYEEVLEAIGAASEENASTDDLGEALHNSSTLRSFVVVEGEEELASILRSPLDKWRTFLHPSQRVLVNRNYNGPARVLGGAGTGKTVVAMHRARVLARKCSGDQRVLFTTFSTNLAGDIQANMDKLCTREEMRRIRIVNLDAWVSQFLKEQGFNYHISYEERELNELWEDAIIEAGGGLGFEPAFLADEWAQVLLVMDELTLESYVHARRMGRGSRLRRKDRMQIWEVVECYRRLMRERNIHDVDAAMRDARLVLEQNPAATPYAYVVVDEAQDFSAPAFRLIRAIAGKEHPDDLFIVGDSHQRIYGKKAVLSRCGINIRGRARRLRINYRTPEEIRRAAVAVIAGLSWDDLDGGADERAEDEVTQSLLHGERPEVKVFRDITAEIDWISEQIDDRIGAGQDDKDICVVLRSNKLADDYARGLVTRGHKVMRLKARRQDDRSINGVRVATMHRVKGLEFDTVFLAGMDDGTVPPAQALSRARVQDNVAEVEQSERSLVYVAMTRAKRTTTITASGRLTKLLDG